MKPLPRHASAARAVAPAGALVVVLFGLSACVTTAAPGLVDLLDRPSERALFEGLRAYDDAQYGAAEKHLRQALAQGLASARDRATAHKLLAFMQCTSDRLGACEADFRAARQADPAFVLNRAEAGHPLWGPVYRRALP